MSFEESRSSSVRRRLHWVTLVGALFTAACNDKEAAPPIRPVLSMVVRATTAGGDVAIGTVEPRYLRPISAFVSSAASLSGP